MECLQNLLTIYSVSIWKRCNITCTCTTCTKAGRWWTNLSQSHLGRATIWFAKFWFASLASFQVKASSLLVLKQMFSIKRKPCAIPVWSAGFAHLLMIKCQKIWMKQLLLQQKWLLTSSWAWCSFMNFLYDIFQCIYGQLAAISSLFHQN